MACLRPALSPTTAPLAPVYMPAVVGLADVKDPCAPSTTNRYQHRHFFHERTSDAALREVALVGRSRAPCPRLRPRATRRLRALHLGLHPLAVGRLHYGTLTEFVHFSAPGRALGFLRFLTRAHKPTPVGRRLHSMSVSRISLFLSGPPYSMNRATRSTRRKRRALSSGKSPASVSQCHGSTMSIAVRTTTRVGGAAGRLLCTLPARATEPVGATGGPSVD